MAAWKMAALWAAAARPRVALLAVLPAVLLLGGCAGLGAGPGGMGELLIGQSAPQLPPPAGSQPPRLPMDPLAAFAMAHPPGHEGSVEINGVAEPARVLRAYHAASGLECREVMLGRLGQERAQLACGQELAQPLLRGSGRR